MDAEQLQQWQAQNKGASDDLRERLGRAHGTSQCSPREDWQQAQQLLPPACGLCGAKPFHPCSQCPTLATSASIQRVLDRLVEWDGSNDTEEQVDATLDIIAELEFHLEAVRRRENEQHASTIDQDRQSNLPQRSMTPDVNRRSEWASYQLARRSKKLAVKVPPEFEKLQLPTSREEAGVDFNRVLAKMSPWWPWYPPPPLEPVELGASKERIERGCPLPGDNTLVCVFQVECDGWSSGVDFFLRWYHSDEVKLQSLLNARALRPTILSKTELEEEFRASLVPRSHVQYANVMHDPTAPPFVCQWRERSFSELRGTGQHSDVVWYVRSNVTYRPRHIPSASLPRRRVDGHYGEHTPAWYPQWLLDGQWYIAFHDRYLNADGSTQGHSDPTGRFMWYRLHEDHCVRSPMRVRGAEHLDAYFLGLELLHSISRDHRAMLKRVHFWREAHFWAADFPHDQLQTAEYVFRMLTDVPQSMRNLRDTVAGYQRALGLLNAWCNYRAEFRIAMQARDLAAKMGRPFMPATKAKDLGRYTGAYVESESRACLLNGLNCEVFLVTPKPRGWEGVSRRTALVNIHVELRAWEDGSFAPMYVSNLRTYDPNRVLPLTAPSEYDYDSSGVELGAADFDAIGGGEAGVSGDAAAAGPSTTSALVQDPTTAAVVPTMLEEPVPKKRKRLDEDEARVREDRNYRKQELGMNKHVADWFPAEFGPSKSALGRVRVTSDRQNDIVKRADRPVPLKYRRRRYVTRTPEIRFLAGKANPRMTETMFLVYLVVARYIDEELQARPFDLDREQGLTPAEWQSLLKGMSADFSGLTGVDSDETLRIMQQIGMAQLLAAVPQTVELEPEPFTPMLLDIEHADDDQLGELFERLDRVGQGDGYYFAHSAPEGDRPLAPESDRYLHEPSGWRRNKALGIRGLGDFYWLLEFEAIDKCGEDVIEFMFITVNHDRLMELKRDYDIWVCYERAWVFVLRKMAEFDGVHAAGERIFARPIRRMALAGSHNSAAAIDKKDVPNLRVWHHFDISQPLPVPIDALSQVGSLATLGGHWTRTSEEMQKVAPRALTTALPAPLPTASRAPSHTGPLSVRKWIESHVQANPPTLRFDQYDIEWAGRAPNWPAVNVRKFVGWRMSETNWREQFKNADDLIVFTHVGTTSDSRGARFEKLTRIWGGSGLVPTGANPLASDDWTERLPCVTAMAEIVSSWPGWPAEVATRPTQDIRIDESAFTRWESSVWDAYTLIFSDYMFRKPPQLYIRPPSPA